MEPLKAEQLATSKWRVLAIPFGGPFAGGKDLDGEFFTPRTDIKAHWFPSRPALWHHAKDQTVGDVDLGIADHLVKKDDGWWTDLWLDKSNQYFARVDALLRAGKVFGSTGALNYAVKIAKDGEILTWPYVEQTLTPTPSNLFSRVEAAKAAEHFTSAGIPLGADLETYLTKVGESPAMDELTRTLSELEGLISAI